MSSMFCGCDGLTKLNLNSFNTSNVTNMENMFKDCSNLKTIFVNPSWNTGKVSESNSMFEGCAYLKGGAGTIYDSNKTDDEYARIDGGPENPGYFTYKKPAGITTGIDEAMPSSSMFNVQCDSWFTIDGRKLSGKPAKKGVYIHNGRAVVN